MHIVTVYPIIKGAFKQELTYWSAKPIPLGSIIKVPLRGRNIHALVGEITEATNAKSQIKQASFATRKIEDPEPTEVVRRECVEACIKIAHNYAAPLGAVLKSCIPEVAFAYEPIAAKSKEEKLDSSDDSTGSPQIAAQSSIGIRADFEHRSKTAADILMYQTNLADRLSTYKSIVREEFARKKSVLIIVPTGSAAQELFDSLKRGIEDYVVILYGKLTKKKQLDAWKEAVESTHPILIITTPIFACVPRENISTIIIEKESSRAYVSRRAPFIDFREYAEQYAKINGARLILGDSLLRVDTLYRRESGEVSDFFPVSFRIEKTAEVSIVDMNAKRDEKDEKDDSGASDYEELKQKTTKGPNEYGLYSAEKPNGLSSASAIHKIKKDKKDFKILSEELISMIAYAEKRGENVFVFASRRGLSPQTVCGDCGHTVTCDVCEAPVVLHQSKNPNGENDMPNRYFLCHHCGRQRSALEACRNCSSWKLITLGVAIDNTAAEIKKQFPKLQIFTLDKDSAATDKQAEDMIKKFNTTKGAVLLGTESSLAFLPEVKYAAISSIDSLFSIPDFRINERIMQILLRINEKTTGHFLIQTRVKDQPILSQFISSNLLDFYRQEIDMRESIKYPPFVQHIKITIEDTRAAATTKMKRLQDLLDTFEEDYPTAEVEYTIFPAFVPSARGKSMLHLLITLPKTTWTKSPEAEALRSFLVALPSEYEVRVNPQSLL